MRARRARRCAAIASLALSHGARLVFERLGVWRAAGGGRGRGDADHGDRHLAGGRLRHGAAVGAPSRRSRRSATSSRIARCRARSTRSSSGRAPSCVMRRRGRELSAARPPTPRSRLRTSPAIRCSRDWPSWPTAAAHRSPACARATARLRPGRADREARPSRRPHQGVAFERFTPEGPMALLPEGDRYGLVWTMTPAEAEHALALADDAFLARLARHFGPRVRAVRRRQRSQILSARARIRPPGRRQPLRADRQRRAGAASRSPGRASTSACATRYELGQHRQRSAARRAGRSRDARRLRARAAASIAVAGIAFTHGLTQLFAQRRPPRCAGRAGSALALLDAMPPAKRAFTRAMLFGLS